MTFRFRSVLAAALLATALPACSPGQAALHSAPQPTDERRAKNVILFIGDGMGISTITAARIYDGQSRGEPGEENLLSFERFPHVALVKTYNTNQQVPDSAGAATAINTGVKTRARALNVGPDVEIGDCEAGLSNPLPTAAARLSAEGMAIGIVSTARLTHATPAAVYAHSPDRDWESDSAIPTGERGKGCSDIATQLAKFPFTVALGGGAVSFLGKDHGGNRLRAADHLPAQWEQESGGTYVTTREAMRDAPGDRPLFGLFSRGHMTYMLDRRPETSEPTLSEMTAEAIDRVSQDPDGYFLMIEGGRIDHGHHEGKAAYALSEAQEFARAVQVALERVDLSETLILVTADHSHVFTIGGYPRRGNPILGLAMGNDKRGNPAEGPAIAADGQPYTTVGYMNGPGAVQVMPRPAPSGDPGATQQSLVPIASETHGGEDVPLYAIGAGSAAAHGVIEQNRLHGIIMGALGRAAD